MMKRAMLVFAAVWGGLLLLSHYAPFLAPENDSGRQDFEFGHQHPDAAEIWLLHDHAGITPEVIALAQEIAERTQRRVVLPDLFLPSEKRGDHSLTTLAVDWARTRATAGSPAHVMGLGMGGAAAVSVAAAHPEQSVSVILISATLTQRFDLLGDYSLNRALYALQSGAFWLVGHLVPHFGLLDRIPFSQAALRSLADTDLRPVEAQMRSFSRPVLMLHGEDNWMIPVQAALVHRALFPQARLRVEAGGRGPFPDAAILIDDFIRQVSSGSFKSGIETAAGVDPQHVVQFSGAAEALSGKRFWFITGIVFVGTKFSEDLATVAAGLLVSRDILPFGVAVVTCFLGIMAGDGAIYCLGRFAGMRALRRRPFCWLVREETVIEAEEWFRARGLWVIVLSRFVPATRFPVYLASGILGVPPLKFFSVLGLAALVWTPLILFLAALLGSPLLELIETYERWALPILLSVFLILAIVIKIVFPLATRRGRRVWLRRYVRLRARFSPRCVSATDSK